MPSYENEKCPVCGEKFKDGDDIVTCPECGTPHHRECYKKIGHCINEDKHASGYEFKKTGVSSNAQNVSSESAEKQSAPVGTYFDPNASNNENQNNQNTADSKSNTKKCVSCGADINKNAPFCNKCGARQPVQNSNNATAPFAQPFISNVKTGFENSDLKIDGEKAEDVAGVVGSNVPRFMSKFTSGKKVGWNWAGFIFGPYYLFFRKMYKEGSIFLALQLIVSLVAQGVYAKPYAKFMNFITSNASEISSNGLSDNLLNQFDKIYEQILPMAVIIFAANVILHIVIALFSDSFYKTKVIKTVKDINQKLDEGSMFEQMMPFAGGQNLSQDDMKKMYLGKMGGTSIFTPVLAFFVLDIITSIISRL